MARGRVIPLRAKGPLEAEAETGHFTGPDGVEIYFEDSGGAGPALFYVYGLGCSIKHWKYPMAHFAKRGRGAEGGAKKRRRQIWLDFKGHGNSKPPHRGDALTISGIIEDIVALCEYRGVRSATFLGQSMGGSIVIALAHAHPELVKAMVLLASPGRDPARDLPLQPVSKHLWSLICELNARAPEIVRLAQRLGRPVAESLPVKAVVREVIRQCGFNPELASTSDIEEYLDKVYSVHPNHFFDMAHDLRRFDAAKLKPKVACPALIIAGEMDQIVPLSEAKRLAKALPAARLEVVPHGSHCPHFDDPGYVNRLIEAFLVEQGV
jgi:3-oxoadipate enol-lactonase